VKEKNIWSSLNGDNLNCLDDVASFLHQEFSQNGADRIWSKEYLEWKLGGKNPAGNGFLSYAVSEGRIVGVATLTKKRALYNGRELLIGETGDTYTLSSIIRNGKPETLSVLDANPKAYINKSIFGRLVSENIYRASENGVELVYGTPNKKSLPGYIKRLGFLSYKNTAKYRPSTNLLLKQYPVLKPFSNFLYLTESLLFSLQRLVYSLTLGRGINSSVEVPSIEEIDNLWSLVKPLTGLSLIRDGKYWFYRYINHPLAKYKFISFRRQNRLVAIVVAREFSYRKDRRVLSIVEWMSEDPLSIGYLLSETLNFVKKRNIDYYYYYSSAQNAASMMPKTNLFLYSSEAPVVFFNNELSKKISQSGSHFEFHIGNSDAV